MAVKTEAEIFGLWDGTAARCLQIGASSQHVGIPTRASLGNRRQGGGGGGECGVLLSSPPSLPHYVHREHVSGFKETCVAFITFFKDVRLFP